ncbi:MAG TPA: hypothetical protein PK876_03265 [Elusimicrobiota bacterium]|nr:hypothetical protein [Elusimicrobiota bacterium]
MILRAVLLALFSIGPLGAQGPEWIDVPGLDSEYESDRFMSDIPWDWRESFWASPSGVQMTGGSMNIRHLYLQQDIKLRVPLVENRFWFRYRYQKFDTLERNRSDSLWEFEYRPWRDWFVSFLGEPRYHKAEANMGARVRWGRAENRSVDAAILFPNFDTNYAFHNTSVNEGYQEFYDDFPKDVRLTAVWSGHGTSVRAQARKMTLWRKQHRDLTTPFVEYRETGGETDLSVEMRCRGERFGVTLEGEYWDELRSVWFSQTAFGQGRRRDQVRRLVRPAAEWYWDHTGTARIGFFTVRRRESLVYSDPAVASRFERQNETLPFVQVIKKFGRVIEAEMAYVHDRQRTTREYGAETFSKREENRLKLACGFQFTPSTSLRLVTGWELDKRDFGRFAYFDGGTVQFQAVFGGVQ